jgi:outer membrane lipoprotein-sorting protein
MNDNQLDSAPAPDELQGILRESVDAIRASVPPNVNFNFRQPQEEPATKITPKTHRRLKRVFVLAAATAAAIYFLLSIGVLPSVLTGPGNMAFAQTVEQIQKAKAMSFRVTFHSLVTGLDGKKWTELHTIQRATKEPGLWRSTSLDKDGQVVDGQILDFIHGRELTWKPKEKRAVLRNLEPDPNFSGMGDYLKEKLAARDWQWVKKQETPTGTVNVFRHAVKVIREDPFYKEAPKERESSYDVWIDQKTKKLVKMQIPGADIYDLDQHPVRDASPGPSSMAETLGLIYSDFVFDAELDDSLFSLQPPKDYAVESREYPQVTEKDIIEYLGLLAKCRGQRFPDQVSKYPFFPIDWINEVTNKEHLSLDEKLFLKKHEYFYKVNQKPFTRFADSYTEAGSFRYLGKGVKLGDKDAIVCWYKLKDAKDPNAYRVVYGDLNVKDVAAKDLPLPVEP